MRIAKTIFGIALLVGGTIAALAWGSGEKGPTQNLTCYGDVSSSCVRHDDGTWTGSCEFRAGTATQCGGVSGSCTSVNCDVPASAPLQTGSCDSNGSCQH
jgi:hypothetical protein